MTLNSYRLSDLFTHTLAGLTILAHLFAALALVVFGWRAGGYALNGPGSYVYLAVTLGTVAAFLLTWRRTDEWTQSARVTLTPWLALVVAGVWFATSVFGAKYAPYSAFDDEGLFALTNLAYTLIGCGLALSLRWPRLLLTWAFAQGVVLGLNIAIWGNALRYGALVPNLTEALPWLFLPVAYGLAALALGWRPSRRVLRDIGLFALGGLGLTLFGATNLTRYLAVQQLPPGDFWANLTVGGPEITWFTAVVLPLSWYVWRAWREWELEALKKPPSAPAWIGFATAAFFGTLTAGYLLSPMLLPRAGEVQGWISLTHIVPKDAWPPPLAWSSWLLVAVRWLLIPLVVAGVLSVSRASRRVTPVTWLTWLGLTPLLAFSFTTLSRLYIISSIVSRGHAPPLDDLFTSVGLSFGLLFAARAWERPLGPRGRAGIVLLIFALSGLFLWMQVALVWPFADFLFFPLPAWAAVAEYAPAAPSFLAGLGLALHLALFGVGVMVTARWVGVIRAQWGKSVLSMPTMPRFLLIGGSGLLTLFAGWYVLTTPRPVHVVPTPGAAGVPLDTFVLIEFPPPGRLDELTGHFGGGLEMYYPDTGEYINGSTWGRLNGMQFDPEGNLRPGAMLEIIARWGNKRSYVWHFTTADEASLIATPAPHLTGWPSAVATEVLPTPLPTP